MKKTLAAFLAALMMFGMVPVGAADTETTAVVTESDDMRFATSLGIMDDTYEASATITRLELAKCYYNVIMNGADITGFGTSIFTDAAGDESDIVMTCYNMGIMTGTSATTFSPNDPVTYQQLMKTMVVFLGYDSRAVAEGGWPYGYLAVASSLGICKNIAMDAQVTVEQVAKMFRNTIDISMMQRTTFGTYGYETKYGDNWLRLYRNVERVRGTVEANHMTDLGGRDPRDYERVRITTAGGGTVEYLLNENTLDLKNQNGYRVDVFVNVSEEPGTIMHWEYMNADTVVIKGENVASYANGRIDYFGETGREHIDLASNAWVVYNGTYCGSYDESIINPFKTSTLEGSITAVDNDNDGDFDYVEVDAYDTFVVASIVDGKIFTKYGTITMIDTEQLDEDHIMMTNVTGDEMWLDKIEAGDILSVSYDVSGDIKRIVVTIDKLKGTVSEIIDNGDGSYAIGIGETVYECSKSIVNNEQFEKLEVGDTIRMFFNKDGKVSDIERNEFIQHSIGYLVDAAPVKGAMDTNWEVKVFTTGNSMEIYKLAKNVDVDGIGRLKAADAIAKAYDFTTGTETGGTNDDGIEIVPSDRIPRQVIQYETRELEDDTEEITYIDFCEYDPDYAPKDSLYEHKQSNWLEKYYRRGAKSFSGQLLIGGSTAIFDVPIEEYRDDDDAYYIASSVGGSSDTTAKTIMNNLGYEDWRAYGTDADSKVAAAFVMTRKTLKGYSVAYDARMFTVDKVTETVNEENDKVYKITGVLNGAVKTYYAKNSDFNIKSITNDGGLPQKGDVIRVSVDGKDMIRAAEFIFDESTGEFGSDAENTTQAPQSGSGGERRYVYGKVTYSDGTYITVHVGDDETGWDETHAAASYKITTYKKNADEGDKAATVSIGSAKDIYDEYHYPSIGSMVLLQMQHWSPLSMTVYNK